MRSIPASSEKTITEAFAQKEELEKKRLVEEQKLAQVMESLKEETSGLQEEKEVRSCLVCDASALSSALDAQSIARVPHAAHLNALTMHQ